MNKQKKSSPSFAALVQAYFAEYLTQQRALSAQTIAAYRDGFVLFLDLPKRDWVNRLPRWRWPTLRQNSS